MSSFCLNISIVLVAVLFKTFALSALSMLKVMTLPSIACANCAGDALAKSVADKASGPYVRSEFAVCAE